jgi:PAS domain S-box-containing protein
MVDFLARLFDSTGFPPRWLCGTWTPGHGWLHIAADSLIFSAYFAISAALWYLARRRADWPFRHLFWLFGAFILACGTTHLMEAVLFWWPGYRLAGVLKVVTAVASWVTVAALIPALPRALAMRTPEELGREVSGRQAAEAELIQTNAELEDRVRERTAELTQANAALLAERERFRTTLASIGDGVIATDTAGRVTFLNAEAEGQTGWQADAAVGQPIENVFRIVNETTRTPVDNPAARALVDGVVVGLANHTILLGRDGSERHVEDCAAPIRDGAGGVAGAVLVFRDVSKRRQAEAELALQARLTGLRADVATALAANQPKATALQACCEALVRHLGAAFVRIWVLPAGGEVLELRASAGLYTHLDGPHSRIRVGTYKIGRIAATREPHLTNTVADDPEVSDPEWARKEGMVAFAGHPLVVEGRVVGVMALFARHELSVQILADLACLADGIAQYIDRRRAEAQIQDSEERYRLFFDASPLPMWVYDRDTLAFLEVNAAAVAQYGYDRDEFLSMAVSDIRPPEELSALYAVMDRPSGPDEASVWQHRRKDGRVIMVRVKARTMTFRGRSARLVQALDVTDQLRAEEDLRASEERFRTAFDNSAAGMALVSPDGRFLRVNHALQVILGYPEADLLDTDCTTVTHPDDRAADELWFEPMLDGRLEAYTLEKRYLRQDGQPVWAQLTVSLVRDASGRPIHFVAQFQDVMARRAAEADLRASEGRLRLALEAGHMGTFDWDIGTGRIVWSKAHYELFGYDGSDPFPVEFRHFSDRVHPDDRARVEGKVQAAMAARTEYANECRLLLPDGSVRWVLGQGRFEFGPDGRAVRMIGIAKDISSRKADELAVRASEVPYRTLFEMCPDAIYLVDMGGHIRSANPAATAQTGYAPAELRAMRIQDLDTTDHAAEVPDRLQRVRAGESLHFEVAHRRKDGTHVELDVQAAAVEINGESLVLAFDRDITAERAAAAALGKADDLYRLLADRMQDVITVHDTSPQARYLYVSPSGERLTGYRADELVGREYVPEVHPDDLPTLAQSNRANLRGEVTQIEWRSRHKDGRYIWLETVATPVTDAAGGVTSLICTSRDIGRRKEAEDRLRQAQKLEAIGLLAGGVAHDFNNLLTVVNGCSELVLEDLPAEAAARPLLEAILAAGERGAGLTRQLLAFSRQQMLQTEVFDLSGVVPATAKMVGRLLGEDIVMSLRLHPAAGCVKADLGQVEQIIVNLAVNARDAMPTGGTLLIETTPVEVPDAAPRPSPEARPGRYVRLAVTDTGTGMTPEVQARLFEPFFTTKPTGEGTGLGLATVYGIVRQSGGFLTVESEVGRGTTFAVYLPRHDEVTEGPKSALRPKEKAVGSETVLVVEDDASVRVLTTNILLRQGYRVESAADGAAALAVCDRLPAPPDLLLTDVVMPGMSGRELAGTLTSRYPRLRVVFLSGYTADDVLRHGVEEDRVAFLQKPYTPDTLSRFVRKVLDGT